MEEEQKKVGILPLNGFVTMQLCALFACGLTFLSIRVLETYGLMLFIGIPVCLGFMTAILYSYKEDKALGQITGISAGGTFFMCLYMFFFAIDGAICIILLMPLAMGASAFGTFLGYLFLKKVNGDKSKNISLMLVLIMTPALLAFEAGVNPTPPLRKIVTAVEVEADINEVWDLVVAFPEISEPDELMFKLGISYPVDAKIEGEGVGAIRYCNFSTGSFVEPITNWTKPTLLQFDVKESPAPMQETSIYADLEPPHLHDIVSSEKGQFRLTELENGKTVLEGATWYRHDMWPNWYWGPLSDEIIHTIHRRVLNHIKKHAEEK